MPGPQTQHLAADARLLPRDRRANGAYGSHEVSAIGGENSIWRSAPGSSVIGWQRLTGGAIRLAATNNPDGRVEVLALTSAGQIHHAWQKTPG